VLIATLFVIGKGLVRTGVARRMGDLLIAKARNSDCDGLADDRAVGSLVFPF